MKITDDTRIANFKRNDMTISVFQVPAFFNSEM